MSFVSTALPLPKSRMYVPLPIEWENIVIPPDCRTIVEWIVRNERGLYLFEQCGDGFLQTRYFRFGFLRHLGVVRVGELARLGELLLVSLQLVPHFDQWLEMAVLTAQPCHPLLVLHILRIGELSLYLRGTLNGVPQPVVETQLSLLEPAACLPYF